MTDYDKCFTQVKKDIPFAKGDITTDDVFSDYDNCVNGMALDFSMSCPKLATLDASSNRKFVLDTIGYCNNNSGQLIPYFYPDNINNNLVGKVSKDDYMKCIQDGQKILLNKGLIKPDPPDGSSTNKDPKYDKANMDIITYCLSPDKQSSNKIIWIFVIIVLVIVIALGLYTAYKNPTPIVNQKGG